jgi:hypothetical protein
MTSCPNTKERLKREKIIEKRKKNSEIIRIEE